VRSLVVSFCLVLGVAGNATAHGHLFKQPDASAPATISVSEDAVLVNGTTVGGNVVLYGAALNNIDGMTVERSAVEILTDPDHDGVTRFLAKIPFRSVWIAIDFLTGQFATGSRPGFAPGALTLPAAVLKADVDGIVGIFDHDQLAVDLLIVRPGKGVWRLRAFEGGGSDDDGLRNGRVTVRAEKALPVAGTTDPPPKRLKEGDVLAVIDPMRLEVHVRAVTK
jgi:hypothetical protein